MRADLRRLLSAVVEARAAKHRTIPLDCDTARPCSLCRDVRSAESALCDAILASPRLLDIAEAVERLGVARAKFGASLDDDAMFDTMRVENHAAMRAVCALADHLASGGDSTEGT